MIRSAWMMAAALALAGCQQSAQRMTLSVLWHWVKARRWRDRAGADLENYEPFVYRANAMRSPFLAPIEVRQLNQPVTDPNIKPT